MRLHGAVGRVRPPGHGVGRDLVDRERRVRPWRTLGEGAREMDRPDAIGSRHHDRSGVRTSATDRHHRRAIDVQLVEERPHVRGVLGHADAFVERRLADPVPLDRHDPDLELFAEAAGELDEPERAHRRPRPAEEDHRDPAGLPVVDELNGAAGRKPRAAHVGPERVEAVLPNVDVALVDVVTHRPPSPEPISRTWRIVSRCGTVSPYGTRLGWSRRNRRAPGGTP